MRTIDISQEQRVVPTRKERESDWPLAPPSESDLPAGKYIAAKIGHRRGTWFKQEKIELIFKIVEPAQFAGIAVSLFATLDKRISPAWKYYALWVKANGGPPERNSRMSPSVFEGYWHIQIEWSKPRKGGCSIPQVTDLLERVAGGPISFCQAATKGMS